MLWLDTRTHLDEHHLHTKEAELRYQRNHHYLAELPTTTLLTRWLNYLNRWRHTGRRAGQVAANRRLQMGTD